jgi:hypothetical protein
MEKNINEILFEKIKVVSCSNIRGCKPLDFYIYDLNDSFVEKTNLVVEKVLNSFNDQTFQYK